MIACRKSFTDTLLSLARMDKDIIAVTTDARGSVTLNDFAKELPQQFVERKCLCVARHVFMWLAVWNR